MAVVEEIIVWAKSLPLWQQEAIRKILSKGQLDEKDYIELVELCKEDYGVLDKKKIFKIRPLDKSFFPSAGTPESTISILSIEQPKGVNALDPKGNISFRPTGITVVYGGNGAGKSGYARIIKSATRSRGEKKNILPNIFDKSPSLPEALITYSVSGKVYKAKWVNGKITTSDLSSISFFDADSSQQYVQEENEVAYRPFGLDIFDKLASVVDIVKNKLEEEVGILNASTDDIVLGHNGTKAELVLETNTYSAENINAIEKLAVLSKKDKQETTSLTNELHSFDEEAKAEQVKGLESKKNRITNLGKFLKDIDEAFSNDKVKDIFVDKEALNVSNAGIDALVKKDFKEGVAGIGEKAWIDLWEAAKRYSEQYVYKGHVFPHVNENSKCVLCLQELDGKVKKRFLDFDSFVKNDLKTKRDDILQQIQGKIEDIENKKLSYPGWEYLKTEVSPRVSKAIDKYFEEVIKYHEQVKSVIVKDKYDEKKLIPPPALPISLLRNEFKTVQKKINNLNRRLGAEELAKKHKKLNELLAREALFRILPSIKKNAKIVGAASLIEKCAKKFNTYPITTKGLELTKKYITQQLCDEFSKEMIELNIKSIEVEMVQKEGKKGVVFHQIQIKGVNNAPFKLGDVASDGEQRSVALSGFLSELSTADHNSSIVFDDPVSSSDHTNRENIAKRLVMEAKKRQVVVFTHDIVFLMYLSEYAEDESVEVDCYELTKLNGLAGIVRRGKPWIATKLSERVKIIEEMYKELKEHSDKREIPEYESKAKDIYGCLREAWERAVEEILFHGAIKRHEKVIHTDNIEEITSDDIKAISTNMTKCSKFMRGHDDSPADNPPIPDLKDIRKDIDAISNWKNEVAIRRKAKK